jgi:hypothetical protein
MEFELTGAWFCEETNLAADVATVAAVRRMPGRLFGAAGFRGSDCEAIDAFRTAPFSSTAWV